MIQEYDTLLDDRYDVNDLRQNFIALHPRDASVPTNTPFATGDYIIVSLKDNKGFGIKRILQIAFSATVGIAYRIIQDNETPPSWNKINLTT